MVADLAFDSLIGWPDRYWCGSGEDDLTELGLRAARWAIEENEGIGLVLLLEDIFGPSPELDVCPHCGGTGQVARTSQEPAT